MHRLNTILIWLASCVWLFSCAAPKPVPRDQLLVEKLRMRITKVRNAAAETRAVIAASRGAPYLAEIHMRLAELMSEEARYHYMVAYEREQRRSKALHVPQVRFLKENAINTYKFILERYPKTHLADRILFNISHEQRELGNFDDMLATLERLVKEYPDSPYREEALLVLGDYYFDKTEFAKAEKYYSDIISKKDSPLLGLAYYKLAWVNVNLSDCKKALDNFEESIVVARKLAAAEETEQAVVEKRVGNHISNEFSIPKDQSGKYEFAGHQSVNVQREALVDLTYCYAQERKPEQAVAFLKRMAYTREAYVAALAKMASRYAIIEQPRGAAEVARELLQLAPDEIERLDDARMLHNSVVRMKDYSMVGDDVALILRAMRRQLLKPEVEASKESGEMLSNEFEMMVRNLATKSHELLMSTSGGSEKKASTWTDNPTDPAQTAAAYTAYLDTFSDSPNRLEVLQNLADVLSDSGRFLEAGHRFREVAAILAEPIKEPAEDPAQAAKAPGKDKKDAKKPKVDKKTLEARRYQERREALFNAVAAYQSSLESEAARGHLERVTARAGLREAGGQYLAQSAPDKEKAKRIKFAIAQSYYDEGSYLRAIDLLTAVAYEYAGTPQGKAAVHMVMDSLRTINDISAMIDTGRRFLDKNSPFDEALRAEISPIIGAAEQRRLDELSLAASGDQAGGMETLLAFADRYKNSSLGERAMLSAFVAARAGGDVNQLYSLGEQVISKFPNSDQVSGVVSTMGSTAAARFEFDRAINYFEKSAQMSKEEKGALWLAAGKLREQLADRQGALADYRKAVAEGDAARAEAAANLADLIAKGGSASDIVNELKPLSETTPDPEITSRLGLAMLRLGQRDDAEMMLRNVVEGGMGGSAAAQARANYGMAEINLKILEDFNPPPDIGAIEEAVALVDMTLQAYLSSARQPDLIYSQAALARLARAAEVGAEKLERIQLPAELGEEERNMITQAMQARAAQLRNDRNEALAECANRAKATYLLAEAGRACIVGVAPKDDPVVFHALAPRHKASKLPQIDAYRDRLAKNPDDLEALRAVGKAFLDAGDAHAARLVLGRTVEAGGGAEDLNVVGVASYRAGDKLGAMDAFGRAKDAGSAAAVHNLAAVYQELGLVGLSKEILKDAPKTATGVLLKSGGK